MDLFVLSNPYSLRTCMRLHPPVRERVYPIRASVHHSFVKVAPSEVHFVVFSYAGGFFRCDVCVDYDAHRVTRVRVFCFEYLFWDRCWSQRSDEHHYARFRDTREKIRAQLSHYFRTVDSQWRSFVGYEDGEAWFLATLRAFDQACTPKTRAALRRYVRTLRSSARARTHRARTLARTHFRKWTEWYFDPDNLRGFVKRLRMSSRMSSRTWEHPPPR